MLHHIFIQYTLYWQSSCGSGVKRLSIDAYIDRNKLLIVFSTIYRKPVSTQKLRLLWESERFDRAR